MDLINPSCFGIQNSILESSLHLYNSALSGKDVRTNMPFYVTPPPPRIKYLVLCLTKEMGDLYNENLTTEGLWTESQCYCTTRVKIVKMAVLPKLTYRSNALLSKF